jgi:predicted Zn-dependent protease
VISQNRCSIISIVIYFYCAVSTFAAGAANGANVVDQELEKDPIARQAMEELDQNKLDKALIDFDKFLAKNPNSPAALLLKGTTLAHLKRDEEAVPVFQKSIQQFEKQGRHSALAYAGLGTSYLALHRVNEAITQFDLADSSDPDNPTVQILLARAYLANKNPYWAQMAIIRLDRAESLDFKADFVPLFRARALELSGQKEEAQTVLTKMIEGLPKTPDGLDKKSKLEQVIQHLQNTKIPNDGPTPPEKRHYDLKATPLFTVIKTDRAKNLVTVVTAYGRDADHGAQDGENDGYMVMPKGDFDSQAELKGSSYRLKQ